MILLDTNVISELTKAEPNQMAVAYLEGVAPETVFTAAICEAEIRYGLARMPGGRNRDDLIMRMTTFFETGFPARFCASTGRPPRFMARSGMLARPPASR